MVQGLPAYESVAHFFEAAADVTGDARSAIITEATALSAQAGVLFNRGWASVVNVEAESGIDVNQQPVRAHAGARHDAACFAHGDRLRKPARLALVEPVGLRLERLAEREQPAQRVGLFERVALR